MPGLWTYFALVLEIESVDFVVAVVVLAPGCCWWIYCEGIYIYEKKDDVRLNDIKPSGIDINSHWSLGFSFFRFFWGHILQGVVVFGFSKRQIRAKKCKTLQESQHSHDNGRTAATYPPPMRLPRLLIGLALQVSSQVNLR